MDEFEDACTILSEHTKTVIPKEHVLGMARNMDLNKDGQIDFNEFLEAFRIVDQFGRELDARRTSYELELTVPSASDDDLTETNGGHQNGFAESVGDWATTRCD